MTQNQKLAIGPLNQAGQGRAWANAVSSHLGIDARSIARDGLISARLRGVQMNGRAHSTIPHPRITPPLLRTIWAKAVLDGTTHLLNESNISLVKHPRDHQFSDEVLDFQRRGVRMGIVFHGSEIRDPKRHKEAFEYSYFKDAPQDWVDNLNRIVRRNRTFAEDSGLTMFVTTPDLLDHVPGAKLLPLAIDTSGWNQTAAAEFGTGRPRVLHRPSRSDPPIKGTQYIHPILSKLADEGLIEYVHTYEVPHADMFRLLNRVDIVVDQIQTGAYGVAAIEAMAAGRLVVGNVTPGAPGVFGSNVPIVNATPVTFEEVMRDLLAYPETARVTAASGKEYVAKWHSGIASAHSLQGFLETS